VIPKSKLRGLREALERDHVVRFKGGAQIEYEDCERCEGTGKTKPVTRHSLVLVGAKKCPACDGEQVRLLVIRPAGGRGRYQLGEIRRAYEMALDGPPRRPQPAERDYGPVPF